MIRKISFSAIAFLITLLIVQLLGIGALADPANATILFTPKDLAVLPGTHTLYLTDNADSCLVAADLQTGQTQTLSLPYAPTKFVCAGGSVYVALRTPDSGADSLAVIDPATFTVTATIPVNLDISGLAADASNLYVYSTGKLEAIDFSGKVLSSLDISSLYDLKVNSVDGYLYGTTSYSTVCVGMPAGQLTLLKQNTTYSSSRITLLPDGKNLLMANGVVLSCNADSAKALVFNRRLPGNSASCTDAGVNELYIAAERLIQVYDASTLAAKRVLPQTGLTDYLLGAAGNLVLGQKDATNNLYFREVDPGTLLTQLKLNGNAISELYPLENAVDGGTVSNATASVDISVTPALASAEVSGNTGTVPLAVGKNTLSISVKNPATGNTLTYTLTITRAAKDFPQTAFNGFTNLGFIPQDFVVDPDRNAAYMTSLGGYSLFRMDLTTGNITERQFSLPADRLAFANGNIYVTLLRQDHTYAQSGNGYGAFAVVDADTFTTKAIFNTNIDPYDIEASSDGYVYIAPGSNQWSILASYDGKTGAQLSSAGSVYYHSYLGWNPVYNKLYSVTSNVSPIDITAYETSSGVLTKMYDSPYHGDYAMGTYLKVSPDGKYIFNGSGCIFTSAPTSAGDMVYSGTLGSSFTSIAFNPADHEFYTAKDKTLTVYDYDSRSIKNIYTLVDSVINMSFSGGKFMLLQENANLQYYVRSLTIGNHAADLASLGLSAGTLSPAFDANRLNYSLILPAGTSSVTISPATADSGATFTIDGNTVASKTIALDQGGTASVTVAVQSPGKALTQTYTLFIYRQTADHTLLISPSFFTPTQQISAGGSLYMAAKNQPFLFKLDGASGTLSALPLPGIPNALGCAGNAVFAAMEDSRTNTFSIGVINTATFTVTDTFSVDTRFTGIRGDDGTIYAFTSSVIKGYARSNHQPAFSKAISSIVDVQPNALDGMIYIASSSIASYSVKNGQLTLVKTNSTCAGQPFAVMPDGMHLVLPNGTVLRCSNNPAYDLMPETLPAPLPSLGSFTVDATTNELYSVDTYLNDYMSSMRNASYLISVFDATDFSYKGTRSDPTPMQSALGSSGVLYVAQADSKGNTVLRATYTDAMLQALKINGDVKDGLYPLRTAVDAGEMPASAASVNIEAVVGVGDVLSGDTGTQPLAVGKNVFSLTVTNLATGHAQTYSISLTRRASDPAATDARVNLGFTPLAVVLDPDRQVEYMTVANDKNLYRVDLQTGSITQKTFSVPVERLAVNNGKLYATLLRTGHQYYGDSDGFGAVAVIDTATFTTTAVFSTNIDPYDIAADDAGNVYLAPGSDQWSVLASYSANTGAPLSVIYQVFNMSYINWNPIYKKVYLITTNVSPMDIYAFETSGGVLTKTYDSPYHGDYNMSAYERVSPDGTRIFNGSGAMFACKPAQTGDMTYLGTLGKAFTTICFDLPNNRFYAAQGNTLTVYSYNGGAIATANVLNVTDSFLDLQFDGTQIIAVQKSTSGKYYTRAILPDSLEKSYTVTFKDSDGSVLSTQSVKYGNAASAPSAPAHTGYTFTGWSADFSNITCDLTVTAQYKINSYTVTFKDWNGSNLTTQSVNYGSAATAPSVPGRTGYTFTGWDTDFSKVTSNLTVTAQYKINSYTVTFKDWDGTILNSQSINYGSAATAPAAPTRTGYTFSAWNADFSRITSDLTVTALYSINTYTVTFKDWDGTVLGTRKVNYGGSATAFVPPARAGYVFTGWDADFSKITADLTVTAQYVFKGSMQITCKNSLGDIYPGVGMALYEDSNLANLVDTRVSDASGVVAFTGLDAGTYWLVVSSVPSGYSLTSSNDPLPFTVSDGNVTEANYVLETSKVYAYSSNQLEDLQATAGAFDKTFDPNANHYTLTLNENTDSTTITPILANMSSTLYMNGIAVPSKTISLSKTGSSMKLTIKVKPTAGLANYYYVTILREKSSDVALAMLKATRGDLAEVDATHYTVNLSNIQTSTTISLKLDSKYAKYSMALDGKRTSSKTVSVKPGMTRTLLITVTPQAGAAYAVTYTITIYRAISHNADLSVLQPSRGMLAPGFTPDNTGKYLLSLTSAQSSVTLTVKLADPTAKYSIRINGKVAGRTISLAKGASKEVTIIVTSQAGDIKTYVIDISRSTAG